MSRVECYLHPIHPRVGPAAAERKDGTDGHGRRMRGWVLIRNKEKKLRKMLCSKIYNISLNKPLFIAQS